MTPCVKCDMQPWHCEIRGMTAKKCRRCGRKENWAGGLEWVTRGVMDAALAEKDKQIVELLEQLATVLGMLELPPEIYNAIKGAKK